MQRVPLRGGEEPETISAMRGLAIALTALCWLALPIVGQAQMSQDFHFQSDATRRLIVDDRGGQGVGYSFEVDYDPDDFNGENHCSHCSFSVFISDPELNLPDLEQLGITREQISTASGLVTALQALAAADPATIAMQVQPGLMGADLDQFIMEATAILADVEAALMRLETLVSMQDGTVDWEVWDDMGLQTIIDLLGLKHDSAYRADFFNPNDPRMMNSGVGVYDVPELISALAGDGASMQVQTAIETALSAIPNLPGAFELSGDDDDPLRPVSYHGIRTDLTIRQRSYVVNGHSAVLYVYTIVNDTSRVLPWVAASMIADFDIPPGSYDSETDFDAALNAVMVYDNQPLLDPEQHHWFGLAPAGAGAPAPGTFSFANFNTDNLLSLSQFSRRIEDNRFRFYMWHPDVSGDHDDAMGKSEKQGAVMTLLNGPMLPGDQRSVAFCFANGKATSSGAARASMTATLTACRAMYTLITPNCGDGVLQFGEECEPATSTNCTPLCERQICGDGRINGTETCDDGNTTDLDGCSADCQEEVCGNGIVTSDEECDDANTNNLDGCLNNCLAATCGDGFLKDCSMMTGGVCGGGGCGGRQFCFTGTMTFIDDGTIDPLDPLVGAPVTFEIGFDAPTITMGAGSLITRASPLTNIYAELEGHPLTDGIEESLRRADTTTTRLTLFGMSSGLQALSFSIIGDFASAGRYQISMGGRRADTTLTRDTMGYPLLAPTTINFGDIEMLRFQLPAGSGFDANASASYAGEIQAGSGGGMTELCDDGNTSNFDACTSACVPAVCGDGFVQASEGEECDTPAAWCVSCQRDNLAACGDGTADPAIGEQCDDNNTTDGDGCSALCQTEVCGDGILQPGEECDDGANGDEDGCTDTCIEEFCGDSVVQRGEECDDGAANADTATCLSTCLSAACGDSLVASTEECDDGNDDSGDGCSGTCTIEVCSDGLLGMGEECDDGNTAAGDGCGETCQAEYCGDALPGPGEQCDDGNPIDGDGCNKDCSLEDPTACGDGSVGPGEQCDDGGTAAGDGCSMFCQLENPDGCGNGTPDPGEQCDDGNDIDGDGCTARCAVERCGDGVHHWGERCDDGNNAAGDGCSPECDAELWNCGNGVHEFGEQCDDGNDDDADACSVDCEVPEGSPSVNPTCGNGALDYGEQCDDGDRDEGDGCGVLCQREASVCGNGGLEYYELCDDGNTDDGDGCSSTCELDGELADEGCSCRVPGRAASPLGPMALLLILALSLLRRSRG